MSSLWVQMLGAETRFYDAGGIRTRCVEAGEGEDVIFLHGVGGHAEAFARNIIPLSARFHVMSLDYLGFGLTDKPQEKPTIADYVNHLIAFMDAAGITKAHLVGESLGGWVAMWTALEHPDRVGKIVSVCGARLEVDTDEKSKQHARDGLANLTRLTNDFVANPSRDGVKNRLRWLFHNPDRDVTDELVDVRWAIYQNVNAAGRMSAPASGPSSPAKEARADDGLTPERLSRITNPTLLLWTSHNPTTTAETAAVALPHLPNGTMTVMDDCGHWPQWEDPDTFNRLVTQYLTESD